MKKVIGIFFTFLFAFTLVFGASNAPTFPHDFEGNIIIKDSSNPNGKVIMASIGDVVIDSYVIISGYYKLSVLDNLGTGETVKFFIGEEKAKESFNYEEFGDTITNLTFDTAPIGLVGDCGDGICAVEECSFCAIDCESKCIGNNVCDVAIGEDKVTAPVDCIFCGDGTCNNGETCSSCSKDCGSCGGGSPKSSKNSGSSGSGFSSLATENVSNENATKPEGFKTIEELNEISNQEVEIKPTGFFSLITGAVIGNGTGNWIAILFLILLVLILFFVARKRKEDALKNNSKKKKK